MAAKNKSNELKLSRIFDAPVRSVWDAWTEPDQVAQWWGPRGFTITTHKKDLRTGGTWAYTMHGPDGVDYENTTAYLEVEKYAKLVYDHGGHADRPPLFRVTVLFAEVNGQTKMDMTMALATPEAAEETRKFIKKAGGDSTWDRLAEYLDKKTAGAERFVINRTFEAPIETLFDVWTKPEHLAHWMGPANFQTEFLRADIRSGGSSFYCMSGPGAPKMYGRAEYQVLERPGLLVYTQQFCDENEKVTRHPFEPNWPETMLTTVRFTAEGPDQTRVKLVWEPKGSVSPTELAVFLKARAGMTQGWTGSFDHLDDYLARRG